MSETLSPHFPPKPHRVHELCGPGRVFFALAVAARAGGTVLWVREGWQASGLNPVGLLPFLDPADLLVADCKDQTECLAVTEEALRAGALGLVVVELGKPLDLTAGRRLQLAAKAGPTTALALIAEDMGSNAAETRWRCTPVFSPDDSTRARWDLIKNKSGTLRSWDVRWDDKTHRVAVVSAAGERPGSAGARG